MARTVKPEEYAEKRNEILNVVRRLVYTKGYVQMTIQHILGELQISKGAFYHYFDSKEALLEALTQQMMDEAEAIIIPIVDDPNLTAIEKFQQFFTSISSWKATQKALVVAVMRVWFADDNVIVRQKISLLMTRRIAPLFGSIVRQGIQEQTFSTPHPERAGEVILSLMTGMQNAIGMLMFASETSADPHVQRDEIIATYDVYLDAMERTLGASPGSLFRVDAETVQMWIDALRNSPV